MLIDIKSLKSANRRIKIFFITFWVSILMAMMGLIMLFIYNDNLQKVSISLATIAFGISMSWISLSIVNNTYNELKFDIFKDEFGNFKDEIRTQLNKIENKIDKK